MYRKRELRSNNPSEGQNFPHVEKDVSGQVPPHPFLRSGNSFRNVR